MASRKSSQQSAAGENDRESARQKGELAALRRMLIASEGTSSLSFAIYNIVRLRDELVEVLSAEFPQICVIRLPNDTKDVLDVVRQQSHGNGDCRAIFVLDIERPLSAAKGDTSLIRALNASREQWESLSCPVVFWLADHAAALLSSKAVDLWRYRSHIFEFAAPVDPQAAQQEAFRDYEHIAGLSFEEKRFRRAELEKRLEDIGDQPSTALLSHVLGWIYELAKLHEIFSDWEAAEELKRRALRLAEGTYGKDAPETSTALNNLAQLLQDTNRLDEAELLMRRSLAIDESSYGENHPKVAIRLNNLAALLQATNRLEEAEPLMRRALAILESSFRENHPTVATCLNNLALLLQVTNRLEDAEPLMRRSLAIDESWYGENHPVVARDLNNLARLLQSTNRLNEAEPLMRRSLAIGESSYGENHPVVATCLNNLALLLQATNRVEKAEPLMRRSLVIDESSYGENHPEVATNLNNLARLLQLSNRLDEAEPLMRRHVEIFRNFAKNTGYEHPHMRAAIGNYTHLLQSMDMPEQEIRQRIAEAAGDQP